VRCANVRGSTGLWHGLSEGQRERLGGGDLDDEVYGAKFLTATASWREEDRHYGGSTGLYDADGIGKSRAVGRGGEQFASSNWLTMLEHEDPFCKSTEIVLGDR